MPRGLVTAGGRTDVEWARLEKHKRGDVCGVVDGKRKG